MDIIYTLAVLTIIYYVVCLLLILIGDCDLLLQLAERFGKPTSVLKGKVVWITGGSSGIGEYLAYDLAKAGCRLILSARRKEELERVKKQCLLHASTSNITEEDIMVLPLDCLKMDTHQDAVDKVLEHFKHVDILVNNAGRSQRAEWTTTSLEVDREMLELNVMGVLSLTKKVLPHMVKRKEGHIVNMSSIAGKLGAPGSGSYCGAKHAIQGWFDCLRAEVFYENIQVTNICPGPVFSNILDTAFTDKTGQELKGKMNPTEKRMSTSRCTELCAIAIANKLHEVWIALNPVLLITYVNQYFPNLYKIISSRIGMSVRNKIREGKF